MNNQAAATLSAKPALPPLTQQLMGIMDEMIGLMQEELPVIESGNNARHGEIIRRKQELAVDYQAALQSLAGGGKLPQSERDALKAKGKQLETIATSNAEVIKLTHGATERLLKVMMNEIRKDIQQSSGYSPRGNFALAEKDNSGPVALNRTL